MKNKKDKSYTYYEQYITGDDLYNLNHCIATRKILKEAQQGDKLAREILVAYPPEMKAIYSFPPNEGNKYIFSRYIRYTRYTRYIICQCIKRYEILLWFLLFIF